MATIVANRVGFQGDPSVFAFRTTDPAAVTGSGIIYWKEVSAGERELFARDEDSGGDIVQITAGNALNAAAVDHGTLAGITDDDHVRYAQVAGRAGENLTVQGNLIVEGTRISADSEIVLAAVNHLYMNDGYVTAVAQTGGLVVNYLPTATVDTIADAFVAGVAATSNPTVVTTGSATFAQNDFIQISDSTSNDGLYEVEDHTGTTLTVRGVGTVAAVEDFTQNQFTAEAGAGAITKVTVSVMRAGTDGVWESASGSATTLTFSNVASVSDNLSVFAATTSAQLAGVISDETGSGLLVFGTSPVIATPNIDAGTVDSLTSLSVRSTGAAFDLTLATATVFTAGRTLTIDPGDSARVVTLSGNPTLADWFDQDVKAAANPTFANLTITSFAANWTNASRTVADLGIVTTADINGGTIDGVVIGGAVAGAITGTTITAGGVVQLTGNDLIGATGAAGTLTLVATSNATPGAVICEVEPGVEAWRTLAGKQLLVGRTTLASANDIVEFELNQNSDTALRLFNDTPGIAALATIAARADGTINAVLRAYSASFTSAGGHLADTAEFFAAGAGAGMVFHSNTATPMMWVPNSVEEMRLLSGGGLVNGSGEGGTVAATGNTLRAPDIITGGAGNIAGADYMIAAGIGTGTGDAGIIDFQLPIVAAAGDNIQTRASRLTFDMAASTTVLTMAAAQAMTISTAAGDLTLSPTGNVVVSTDLKFSGDGSGLLFGEIYVKDNASATTLNSAAKVQVTDFAVDGESNGMTPAHGQDHITVDTAGRYKCTVSMHVNNNAAQTHTVDVSVWKNNGATEFLNCHAHETLTGGSGDIKSLPMSGIIDLAATDTIEIWADTSDAADRSVTFEDITLSLVGIGGT